MEYIALILNILLALFVVFGVIWGLIRGLRKTASRGIFLIITSIIVLFITIPLTKALLQIKINTQFTIGENTLTGENSIEQIVTFAVKNLLGDEFSNKNPEFVSIITNLPLVFINAVVYMLLFWIFKYLLLPLNYLFYKLTFAPKKPKENLGFSAFDSDQNPTPLNDSLESQPSDTNPSTTNNQPQVEQTGNSQTSGELNLTQESVQFKNLSQQNNDLKNELFGKEGTFIKTEVEAKPDIPKFNLEDDTQKIDVTQPPSKKKTKKEKKPKIKYNKHRLWGALVGGFVGLFIMLNTLLPVYGFMGIIEDVNKVKIENLSNESIDLSNKTNGISDQIISAYESSILKPVSKYTGIEGLSLAEFDYLTTQKIGDSKVTLRSDVKNIVVTAQKADALIGKYKSFVGDGNMSALTQEQLNTLIGDAKNVLETAKTVNLVDCVSSYLIPVACTLVLNSDAKLSDNQIVNDLLVEAITSLAESKNINVFDETSSMLELADYLNKQGLLVRVLQNNFENPLGIIQGLDSNFGTEFTNRLFKLQTVNLTFPTLLNLGLNFLDSAINYGYEKIDYSEDGVQTLINSFSGFVDKTIQAIQTLDLTSNIYLTNESLVPLGRMLDTIKPSTTSNLLTQKTYNSIIDYAISTLKDVLNGLLPKDLDSYLKNEFLENLAVVDNWEQEMTKISTAVRMLRNNEVGILGKVVEGETLRKGLNIELIINEAVFENLGKSLDILDSTCLFGATIQKTASNKNTYKVSGTISLFTHILDYANNEHIKNNETTSLRDFSKTISKMQDNLITSSHTYTSDKTFWANELKAIAPLFNEVNSIIESSNFDISDSIGQNLDKAKSTTLLGNGATLDIMSTAVGIISDNILPSNFVYNDGSVSPQVINDKIYELFEGVKANLDSSNPVNLNAVKQAGYWANEIEYYKSLKNIAEKTSAFGDLNSAKALCPDLDKLYLSKTIPNDKIFEIVSLALKDAKYTSTTDKVELSINNLIDNVCLRLSTIASKVKTKDTLISDKTYEESIKDFWTTEFDYISDLMDIKFQDEGTYKVLDNLNVIGKQLDNVVYGYNDGTKDIRASLLISSLDLRTLLASGVDNMSETILNNFNSDTSIKNAISKALKGVDNSDPSLKVNGIIDNIKDETISPISFEKELTLLSVLSKLEVSKDMLQYPEQQPGESDSAYELRVNANKLKLTKLGSQLDTIAYNKTGNNTLGYAYVDNYVISNSNSKIITRNILTSLIIDIFDSAKADDDASRQTEVDAFNTLIDSIKEQMTIVKDSDKVMSWQRELGYVSTLVKLNSGVTYTTENVSMLVGKNLDNIAFNQTATKFEDIEYNTSSICIYIPENGNSLFITRVALSNLMSSFLSTIKKDTTTTTGLDREQNQIVNDIMDNTILSIAKDNNALSSTTPHYNNFESSLSDLSDIEKKLDSTLDKFGASTDIIKTSATLAKEIDMLLNNFQQKPVTSVLLTRRISKLILQKLDASMAHALSSTGTTTNAGKYYNALLTHYNDSINSSTPENYYTNSTSFDYTNLSNFDDPFETIKASLV